MFWSIGLKEEVVMKGQTKLVNCGSKVFVYDFNGTRRIKNLGFERDSINGNITKLKRLLLTNFEGDRFLAAFTLDFNLQNYENIQVKLDQFINNIKKTSGQSNIKYLAVLELPSNGNNSEAFIHLITDVELVYLTVHSQGDLTEEQELEFLEELWEDHIVIDDFSSVGGLIETFTSAYCHSLTTNLNKGFQDLIFHNKLKQPTVLWNDKADDFIRKHNLVDFLISTEEFYDRIGGFVISNEYSV